MQMLTEPMTPADRAAAKQDREAWAAMEKRITELEAALGKAIDYCDAALHGDDQYNDERSSLIRVYRGR